MKITKTEITGVIGIGLAIAKLFGVIIPDEAIIAIGSLGGIFLRQGIKKGR